MKKFKQVIISAFMAIIMLFSLCSCKAPNNNQPQSYDISNSYFSVVKFTPKTLTNVNVQSGNSTRSYVLNCTSSCVFPLYEYTATVKAYSSAHILLKQETVTKTTNIDSYEEFSFFIEVSSQIQSKTVAVFVNFTGKSHTNPDSITEKYQVTFDYQNDSPVSPKVFVEKGKTVSPPNDPVKPSYIFMGWYTEKTFTNKYDFSKGVSQDLTLYAKYELDATTITNQISTDTIKGIVKIYNKCYNTFWGIETNSATWQGSGFCFKIQNGYYYVLTNCHVAVLDPAYALQTFTIEDYQGKTYEGFLYKNPNKSNSAIDPAYDLACLYFKPSSTNVKSLQLLSSNPRTNTDVVAVGAPQGQSNAITYGKIVDYRKAPTLSNAAAYQSNVTFDILCHTAYTAGGSSGGPILDPNLNVIGVHYAGNTTTNRAYAIPAAKVSEFLRTYVYN